MTISDWICAFWAVGVILFCSSLLLAGVGHIKLMEEGFFKFAYCLPHRVYQYTKLNWPACVIVGIILFLTNYLYFILVFIWWLMHVGRKVEEDDNRTDQEDNNDTEV